MNKIKDFYAIKRTQKITITALVIVVLLAGIGFIALHEPQATEQTIDVNIMLQSDDIKTDTKTDVKVIVSGDVKVSGTDNEYREDVRMEVNKAITLKTGFGKGEYTVHVTSAPILNDGSTFKIPDEAIELVIDDDILNAKDQQNVNLNIKLERITSKDMTKEQLDVVIGRIEKEAPDEKELITTLKKQQETAKSDKASVDEIQQDSKTDEKANNEQSKENTSPADTNTGKSDSGTSANSSGSSTSSSGGTTNAPANKHEHNWQPHMVTIPAVPAQGYNETIPAVTEEHAFFLYSDGCKFEITNLTREQMSQIEKNHAKQHGFVNFTETYETVVITPESSRWVETSPAVPARQEQQGWDCACGAHKN